MTQPQYLPPQYSPQYSPIPQYSPPPPQPPKSHKVRNRIGLVLAFVLGGALVIGVPLTVANAVIPSIPSFLTGPAPTTPASPTPTTEFTVTGTVAVEAAAYSYPNPGDTCWTSSGYDDIKEGSQIEVQNGKGDTLALGTLGTGLMGSSGKCEFHFTITGIPEGELIYSFRAGNSLRGGMKFTRQQLKDQGEDLALSIG